MPPTVAVQAQWKSQLTLLQLRNKVILYEALGMALKPLLLDILELQRKPARQQYVYNHVLHVP